VSRNTVILVAAVALVVWYAVTDPGATGHAVQLVGGMLAGVVQHVTQAVSGWLAARR
jgi:hypothetical protein